MADIVNLRTARKRARRQRDEEHSAKSRVLNGLSKVERARAKAEQAKFRSGVDEHRIETGEADEIAGR